MMMDNTRTRKQRSRSSNRSRSSRWERQEQQQGGEGVGTASPCCWPPWRLARGQPSPRPSRRYGPSPPPRLRTALRKRPTKLSTSSTTNNRNNKQQQRQQPVVLPASRLVGGPCAAGSWYSGSAAGPLNTQRGQGLTVERLVKRPMKGNEEASARSRKGSEEASKGKGKAVKRHRKGQGKAVKRHRKVKERQ